MILRAFLSLILEYIWIMKIKRFDIWIANLEPANQSEPDKTRPVVVVQNDMINNLNHTSFVVCPISSQNRSNNGILRVFVKAIKSNGLTKDSYILTDQLRAIDINRLQDKIGEIDAKTIEKVLQGIKIVLDI